MRILLIEEDKDTLEGIVNEIESEFIVDVANNGLEGSYLTQINDYDVIVIDNDLSDMTGIDICKVTREAQILSPILMLSKDCPVYYKAASLDAGADAYIYKPIDSLELRAELKALIRRNSIRSNIVSLASGRVSVDLGLKIISVDATPIFLRRKEHDLLEYLAINKGKIITKEKLLEHVWDNGIEVFSNTLEVHIKTLRDKIEKTYGFKFIKTIKNFGYRVD